MSDDLTTLLSNSTKFLLKSYTTNTKVIGFDADDTLWPMQAYFDEMINWFVETIAEDHISEALFLTEISNLKSYGFGIKAFILSMIETLINHSNKNSNDTILEIIAKGKTLLQHPVEVYPKVKATLEQLKQSYRLVLITKGDIVDQTRKIRQSSLADYFDIIKIMPDKRIDDYQRFLANNSIVTDEFVMVGNSLISDIIPVIKIGARAIYIPSETHWQYEQIDADDYDETKFLELRHFHDLVQCFS